MNKLFLVSFVAIVAACPAFADVTINANASTAQCDNTTLGTYTGPANLNSVWIPAISGAITLNSNRYTANNGATASVASTAASPATVYSLYGTGVYSTQPTTSNWASYTASNRLSALTTSPQMTGYTFDGFYTTKASGGTQLIDSSGNFKYNTASSQISTDNDTATWYAHWTPINYTITFAKNTADVNGTVLVDQNGTTATPTGTMSQQTYAYDSTANLTSNAYSITGYNFDGWSTTTNPAKVNGGNATLTNAQSVTYKYPGNATLTARWDPVKSGAITLDPSVYPNNDNTQTALYTVGNGVTAPTTATVYSEYNTGLYSDSTYTTDVVAANLIPSKVGYTFGGFYNSAGTTQYIEDDGSVQPAGTRAVTTSGGTDIWYANWTPINYQITYAKNTVDTNGNTLKTESAVATTPSGTMANQTFAYDSTASLRSNAYSITGYNFDGWSTATDVQSVNGGNASYTNGQSVTWKYPDNATLTAQWSPIKSGAITLNSNVYPNNDRTQTPLYTTSTSEAVTPPTTSTIYTVYNTGAYSDSEATTPVVAANLIPSKAGYTFISFSSASNTQNYTNSSGEIYHFSFNVVTTENDTDTWYAKWRPIEYSITYKPGTAGSRTVSGSNVVKAVVYDGTTYEDESALVTLAGNTFSIAGYSFAGWSSDYNVTTGANTTTLYNANTAISPYKVADDIEMTATWNPICSAQIALDSKKYSLDADDSGVAPTTAASPSSIYVLYDNGMYTDNACTSTTGLTNGNITIPTLTGYSFTGFYSTEKSAVNGSSGDITIDSTGALTSLGQTVQSGTFYAGWTPKTVNLDYSCGKTAPSVTGLTIRLNLESEPPRKTTATYDDSETLESSAGTCALFGDRGGFHFGGWSCAPNPETGSGTATYTSVYYSLRPSGWRVTKTVNPWHADQEVTCTVIWTGNDYTISYDHGTAGSRNSGFSGTMSDQSVTFGDDVTLTANAFSIPGYEFAGWSGDYNNSTGANTVSAYTDRQQFTYILPNNLSLTAQWTPINYTITYACGDGTGNAPTTNTSATYDAQFTPATNTCTPPTGHSFTGWLVSGTQTTVNSAFTWEYTENKTLTAQYTANNITLSWNPDGGTAQDGTTYAPGTGTNQCTYGGDITMPAIPKKNGYHLLGWDLIQN